MNDICKEYYKGIEESMRKSGVWEEDIDNVVSVLKELHGKKKLKRLFIDMDGTLAEFKPVDQIEQLYEKGYFADLTPLYNVVDGIKTFKQDHLDYDVFILSSTLLDSPYALPEKNDWLNKFLPEINQLHRFFSFCGQKKSEAVPYGIQPDDVLLDDYSANLFEWTGKGIKLMNGINGTKGSWQGQRIDAMLSPQEFANQLYTAAEKARRFRNIDRSYIAEPGEEIISVKDYNAMNTKNRSIRRTSLPVKTITKDNPSKEI